MEADTGQIRALASLPDFDPNLRPPLPTSGDPADSPLFNRAAQGRYELGSTFKPFTVAMALEAGLVGAADPGRHQGADALGALHHPRLPRLRAAADGRGRAGEVVEHRRRAHRPRRSAPSGSRRSSAGSGCSTPSPVELTEAGRDRAAAAAALVRPHDDHDLLRPRHGGDAAAPRRRLRDAGQRRASGCGRASSRATRRPTEADRVISERTSRQMREMLRQVVVRGTAQARRRRGLRGRRQDRHRRQAERRPAATARDKTISTFAAFFPASRPEVRAGDRARRADRR